LLVGLLGSTGCTSMTISMRSIETPSRRTPEQVSRGRIALLPIAGRLASQQVLTVLRQGEGEFVRHMAASNGILVEADAVRVLAASAEARDAYPLIVEDLVDFDPDLFIDRKTAAPLVRATPWDGSAGIKYTNVLALYERTGRRGANAPKLSSENVRLNWSLGIKDTASLGKVDAQAAGRLARALDCDYMLIPVSRDSYFFERAWFSFTFIPMFTMTRLVPHNAIALYLVDGSSGEIVRSIQIQELPGSQLHTGGVLPMAAALERVSERSSVFGRIETVANDP